MSRRGLKLGITRITAAALLAFATGSLGRAQDGASPSAESRASPSAESKERPSAESKERPSAESKERPSAESKDSPSAESKDSPSAESKDSPSAESMAARAKAAYGPLAPQRPKACGTQDKNGEIVVCAPEDSKQWRIPSTSDSDPTSRQATRTGVPRAPQLDRGSCKGKGQLGCIGLGRAAPPIYMIDLSAIPATPKGSDAEKVAKGEMSDR